MKSSIRPHLAGGPRADLDPASEAADALVRQLAHDVTAQGLGPDLRDDFFARAQRFAWGTQPEFLALRSVVDHVLHRLASEQLTADDLSTLVRIIYFSGHHQLLVDRQVKSPAYDVLGSYEENIGNPVGPILGSGRNVRGREWNLLGRKVGFPIGVPASVLTGGEAWVSYFANNGFNVLTYKTVRSRSHRPNAQPNWAFAQNAPTSPSELLPEDAVVSDPWDWEAPGSRGVTTVNSFGVPSLDPDEWMADVENCLGLMGEGQLLMVSVMGDDYDSPSPQLAALVADFCRTARMAQDAGASVVELNLSCPNSLDRSLSGVKPPLCHDAEVTTAVVEAVRDCLDEETQIVTKLSYLDEQRLAGLVPRIAPFASGISGINTMQRTVRRSDGQATFPGRDLAGVSGAAIRTYALDFVRRLAELREKHRHEYDIVGMGGVTDPESFEALFASGANAVQAASGAFANPFLARECIEALESRLSDAPPNA